MMKCVICKNGKTAPGTTIFTTTKDELIVVIKDVPAQICDNCGEEYVDAETTARLLESTSHDVISDVEVMVQSYLPA